MQICNLHGRLIGPLERPFRQWVQKRDTAQKLPNGCRHFLKPRLFPLFSSPVIPWPVLWIRVDVSTPVVRGPDEPVPPPAASGAPKHSIDLFSIRCSFSGVTEMAPKIPLCVALNSRMVGSRPGTATGRNGPQLLITKAE